MLRGSACPPQTGLTRRGGSYRVVNESHYHSKKDRIFVEPRPTVPAPGAENFRAREEEDNLNHED